MGERLIVTRGYWAPRIKIYRVEGETAKQFTAHEYIDYPKEQAGFGSRLCRVPKDGKIAEFSNLKTALAAIEEGRIAWEEWEAEVKGAEARLGRAKDDQRNAWLNTLVAASGETLEQKAVEE